MNGEKDMRGGNGMGQGSDKGNGNSVYGERAAAGGNDKKKGDVIAVILAIVLGAVVGAGGTLYLTRVFCGGGENRERAAFGEERVEDGNTARQGQDASLIAADDNETQTGGTEEGREAADHIWAEATCTEPRTCTDCGETQGEALGHVWTEADCRSSETCSVCGETQGSIGEHVWTKADCRSPKTCSICGETEGETAPHDYDESGTCTVCYAQRIEITWDNMNDFFTVTYSTSSLDSTYDRIVVTVQPVSGSYAFEDVQLHIGMNLERDDGQLYYDAPLDFNSNDREAYYDVDREGNAVIEGYFPKDYRLDAYRGVQIYDGRGYCVRE